MIKNEVPRKAPLTPSRDREYVCGLKLKAASVRRRMVEMGHRSQIRLHYGAIMGMVEMVVMLYFHWLDVRPNQPDWSERDRFVLSKGHGVPALYAVLGEAGFFEEEAFDSFRRLGTTLQGHPDRLKTPGIDVTSGSLGQGLGVAVGLALGAKLRGADWRTCCMISDGECNEGSIWEAALVAANQRLDNLIVLMDRNRKSSYGVMVGRNAVEPLPDKWREFGWAVFETDGHDFYSLSQTMAVADAVAEKPAMVICHTTKGKGVPFVENYPSKPNILLTDDQYQDCLRVIQRAEEEVHHVHG